MRCLEVSINGDVRSVAGVAGADSIEARVSTYPKIGESHLVVTGSVDVEGQPNAEATWLSVPVRFGDEIGFRLVDAASPTTPTLGRFNPSSGASDGLPIYCAFCGKSNEQIAGGMLASERAFICRACVRTLHEVVVSEEGA